MPRNANTQELFSGMRSNDPRERRMALKEIYVANYASIKSLILKNNGQENDVEDVFQESIIVLFEKVRKGELELNCSIKTYLYSVSKNIWMNQLRKKKPNVEISEMETEILVEPEINFDKMENPALNIVKRLLGKLDTESRKVLVLYYYERKKMKEIAQIMGYKNQQVAKNKKSKTIKKLRGMLGEKEFNLLISQ